MLLVASLRGKNETSFCVYPRQNSRQGAPGTSFWVSHLRFLVHPRLVSGMRLAGFLVIVVRNLREGGCVWRRQRVSRGESTVCFEFVRKKKWGIGESTNELTNPPSLQIPDLRGHLIGLQGRARKCKFFIPSCKSIFFFWSITI